MEVAHAFVEPDPSLQEIPFPQLHKHLNIPIFSGWRCNFTSVARRDKEFDATTAKILTINDGYEDQCTDKHYFDLFQAARQSKAKRIVDVGVFMGGSSCVLSGAAELANGQVDLVDLNWHYLQFTRERLRRIYPKFASNIRIYHGTFPTYVKNVMMKEQAPTFIHHDGAHEFYLVVKDLASMFFVRDQINTIVVQDTHLRGPLGKDGGNFVDAALVAVFGANALSTPLGAIYTPKDTHLITPNQYQGNYFLAGRPEAIKLDVRRAEFLFPHPSFTIDQFI